MLPFLLYLSAGAITCFHLMLLATVEPPPHPLLFVSLAGSVCLVIAAYLSLFKPDAAAKLALLASLTIWCFYSPAIAKTVDTKLHKKRAGFSSAKGVSSNLLSTGSYGMTGVAATLAGGSVEAIGTPPAADRVPE
jgi:hypothetical protein